MKDTKHKALASLKHKYRHLKDQFNQVNLNWIEYAGKQGLKIVDLKNQVADLSAQLRQCKHDKHDLQSKPCGQSCAPTPGVVSNYDYMRSELNKARSAARLAQNEAATFRADSTYWESAFHSTIEQLVKAEEKVDNLSLALAISVLAHLGFGAWAAFSHIEQIKLFLQ